LNSVNNLEFALETVFTVGQELCLLNIHWIIFLLRCFK